MELLQQRLKLIELKMQLATNHLKEFKSFMEPKSFLEEMLRPRIKEFEEIEELMKAVCKDRHTYEDLNKLTNAKDLISGVRFDLDLYSGVLLESDEEIRKLIGTDLHDLCDQLFTAELLIDEARTKDTDVPGETD